MIKVILKAKIQRTPSGKLLGVCLSIPSKYLENIADKEYVNVEITLHKDNTDMKMTASDEPIEVDE